MRIRNTASRFRSLLTAVGMLNLLNTVNLLATGLLAASVVSGRRNNGKIQATWQGLFIGLTASVCFVSLASIVFLESGCFRHRYLQWTAASVNGVLGILLIVSIVRKRLVLCLDKLKLSGWSLAAGALLLAGLAVRMPISRYPYGGQDQGTYVIMSRMLARTGRLEQRSPLMARTERDPALKDLRNAYPRNNRTMHLPGRYEGFVYLGFYITDARNGGIIPQFFHLHPAWMTVFGWLWGPENGVFSLLLFALLGLVAVWLLATWVAEDRAAGLVAMGLLSIQILQVWTTRYPLSEIPAQGLWLCGVALFGRTMARGTSDDPWVAGLGGVCFGLSLFVRVTSSFLVPVLLLGYIAAPGANRLKTNSCRAFFWAAMAVMLWATVHAVGFSYPYVYDLLWKRLGYRLTCGPLTVLWLGGSCLVGLVLAKELLLDRLARGVKDRIVEWTGRHSGMLTLILFLAAVGVLLWKCLSVPAYAKLGAWEHVARPVQLAAFISWPGLAAGLLGLGLLAARYRSPVAPFLFGFGMWFVLAVLVMEPYNRYAYYYCRYYVSELLPLLMFGAALLISWSFRWAAAWAKERTGWTRWSARGLKGASVALGLYLFFFYASGYFTNPTYRKEEVRGAWDAVEKIAAQIPRDALVLMNRRAAPDGSPGFHLMLGTTLQFGYGYETLVLRRIGQLPRAVYGSYRQVYLFEEDIDQRVDIADSRYLYLLVGGGALPFHHSEKTVAPPKRFYPLWYRYFLYRVLPVDRYAIHPGNRMWASRMKGFHPWEKEHCWSRGTSRVVAAAPKGRVMEVTFVLRGIFPPDIVCPVTVRASGEVVHSKTYAGADLKYKRKVGPFRVPAHLNRGVLDLDLETCTWRPSEVFGTHDSRSLGIDLKSVEIAVVESGPAK